MIRQVNLSSVFILRRKKNKQKLREREREKKLFTSERMVSLGVKKRKEMRSKIKTTALNVLNSKTNQGLHD